MASASDVLIQMPVIPASSPFLTFKLKNLIFLEIFIGKTKTMKNPPCFWLKLWLISFSFTVRRLRREACSAYMVLSLVTGYSVSIKFSFVVENF